MEDKMDNYFEIMNETFLICNIYHIILFTDFVTDPYFKFNAGWSAVSLTLI